ncbi:IS21 family transposase [Microbacterium sp. A93]|uniref:IS21 family transposase n=1 Tax=Microbacterium sp. A93 TaxID=3450716 RepID=UPI003F43E223
MADYRLVMSLLVQGYPYRQIEMMAACSHRTIAKARKVVDDHAWSTREDIDGLGAEDIDRLFADGRKATSTGFVPVDIEKVVSARLGRKKPPLKVLWARYLDTPAAEGARFYGYERFCQIVSEHVRTHDLTGPIAHVPGHTMQVDWAGTAMALTDPITRNTTRVSVFVATLPYSGMVFAQGYTDEKMGSWLDAHRRGFEYFGGVSQVLVPDNAPTASNAISRYDRAREVNQAYQDFLEHYRSAAVPTRSYRPRDKGHVESGVKIVTDWVIHFLADRMFTTLDDLNEAVTARIDAINDRTPFRGGPISRRKWFQDTEADELLELPVEPWLQVAWRKAKVGRDWHLQIDTVKYSVPYRHAGQSVDVRIRGNEITVMAAGEVIAAHRQGSHRHGYVTDPAHAPERFEAVSGLWTRAYFLRQAAKVGPGTVAALTGLLDAKAIEAQGYRSCMNILSLGKNENRLLLEQACRLLVEENETRPVSYTAIKHRITALRAQRDSRPTTTAGPPQHRTAPAPARDTRSAHLDGIEQFSLAALTGTTGTDRPETTEY